MKRSGEGRARFVIYGVLVVVMAFGGCSRKDSPEGALDALYEIAAKDAYPEIRSLLTAESRADLERIEKAHPGFDGVEADFKRKFPAGARWDVAGKTITGSDAELALRCEKHPVENIVGYEMKLRLKREGGAWRIDLRSDLAPLSQRYGEYRKLIGNPEALRRFLK